MKKRLFRRVFEVVRQRSFVTRHERLIKWDKRCTYETVQQIVNIKQ